MEEEGLWASIEGVGGKTSENGKSGFSSQEMLLIERSAGHKGRNLRDVLKLI